MEAKFEDLNVDQQDAAQQSAAPPSQVSPAPPPPSSVAPTATSQSEVLEELEKSVKVPVLYVGQLDGNVDEKVLADLFSQHGAVKTTKIIRQKQSYESQGYGFVEMEDVEGARAAMIALDGSVYGERKLKVNWAAESGAQPAKEDVSNHHNLFVGDLSPEVSDKMLADSFSAFASLSDARVMIDSTTGRSRGYGFVAFRDREDAENALKAKNGEIIGGRSIRLNWAAPKNHSRSDRMRRGGPHHMMGGMGSGSHGGHHSGRGHQHHNHEGDRRHQGEYYSVLHQAPFSNCVVYVGNLPHDQVSEEDLRALFATCGKVVDIKLLAEKGYGFLTFETHEQAANAIFYMSNSSYKGRNMKTGWGKDRAHSNSQRSGGSQQQGYFQGYHVSSFPPFTQYPSGTGYPPYAYQQEPLSGGPSIPPAEKVEGQQNYQSFPSYSPYYSGFSYGYGNFPAQYPGQQNAVPQSQPQGIPPQPGQIPQQMQHPPGPPHGMMEGYGHPQMPVRPPMGDMRQGGQ